MRDGVWVKVAVGMMDLQIDGQYLEVVVRNGGLGFVGTWKSYRRLEG